MDRGRGTSRWREGGGEGWICVMDDVHAPILVLIKAQAGDGGSYRGGKTP